MKILQVGGIIVATAITTACLAAMGKKVINIQPSAVAESATSKESSSDIAPSSMPEESPAVAPLILSEENSGLKEVETQLATSADALSVQTKDQTGLQEDFSLREKQRARLEEDGDDFSIRDYSPYARPQRPDLSYLSFYPYAELPPERKPADIVLDSLRDVQIGTVLEEIKRASDAFGLDFSFMRAVAKIESDFDPKQRTGSYIGLFQLSKYEFAKYGSGEITSPRDNAIAAAYKFVTEATLFELDTHKEPSFSYRYLIHQQGWQGAAEHVSQPDRIAWKSMCATDEGKEKGEKWCKRAIWQNTLPTIKHLWKSVDKLTSGAFVDMWRERVDRLYTRYSEAVPKEANR
jgi:hypothetical protein